AHSATYRVELENEFELKTNDRDPHNLIAHFDQVPSITIQSPSTTPLGVRPDDIVPVVYVATDDFGIASIDAILQVDDKPAETVKVKFDAPPRHPGEPVNVTSPPYRLSVAKVLARQKGA